MPFKTSCHPHSPHVIVTQSTLLSASLSIYTLLPFLINDHYTRIPFVRFPRERSKDFSFHSLYLRLPSIMNSSNSSCRSIEE